MVEIVKIKVTKSSDLDILKTMALRSGIQWKSATISPKTKSKKVLQEIISKGGEMTYLKDAASRQQEIRKNRSLQ